MKVLVFGGRHYEDYAHVSRVLAEIHCPDPLYAPNEARITHIIHGDAPGADRLGGRWAREYGVQEVKCPANWLMYKDSAGPRRNIAMGALRPDLAIGFPGGDGTAHMASVCVKEGI